MRRLVLVLLFLLVSALPLQAAEIAVGGGLVLSVDLAEGWVVHTKAPESLVEEIAEHIEHEAVAQGYDPSPEQVREAALKRLDANEAILYHAASGSHIDIDFSHLKPKEKAPALSVLKKSADYASQSLEGEEGVSDMKHAIRVVTVPGAGEAAQLDATYRHHEEVVTFIGVIGYVDRAWFFLYSTVFGEDPVLQQGAEAMLASATVRRN